MDEFQDLYDEFGNYIGPELNQQEEDEEEQEYQEAYGHAASPQEEQADQDNGMQLMQVDGGLPWLQIAP